MNDITQNPNTFFCSENPDVEIGIFGERQDGTTWGLASQVDLIQNLLMKVCMLKGLRNRDSGQSETFLGLTSFA